MNQSKKVLFLGLGRMGRPMVNNLASSGRFSIDAFDPYPVSGLDSSVYRYVF